MVSITGTRRTPSLGEPWTGSQPLPRSTQLLQLGRFLRSLGTGVAVQPVNEDGDHAMSMRGALVGDWET